MTYFNFDKILVKQTIKLKLNSTKEELLAEINTLKDKNKADETAKAEAEKKVKALEDSIAKLNRGMRITLIDDDSDMYSTYIVK